MPSPHRITPVLVIAAALCLALPASASSAVKIGRADGDSGLGCLPGATFIQSNTGSSTPSYAVPAGGGVIVSWQVEALVVDQTLKLKVVRPTPMTNVFRVVGQSNGFFGFPGPGIQTFPARIPVRAGDRLGFTTGTFLFDGCSLATADPADIWRSVAGDPAVGSQVTTSGPSSNETLNIAATVEPDADGDRFGDESQDECPTDASKQDECTPPNTKITKRPSNKTKKSKAKFKFTSSEANSTFECKLDKQKFKPCNSPKKYKRLKRGKHKFKVRATDAAANTDPTPAKDKFKVVKK
jgi:hypothetical protein